MEDDYISISEQAINDAMSNWIPPDVNLSSDVPDIQFDANHDNYYVANTPESIKDYQPESISIQDQKIDTPELKVSDDSWASKLWSDFKGLDNGTKSILTSSIMSAAGGLFKAASDSTSRNSSTAAKMRELDILQQQTDLKRKAQENAIHSTAESYDKSKYKVQGLLKPTTLKTTGATQ